MSELIVRANGDYRCGNCMENIYFEETFSKPHVCKCCKETYTIPKEAYFMYEGTVMKNGEAVLIDELSDEEKIKAHLAMRGQIAKGIEPVIVNLDIIKKIR